MTTPSSIVESTLIPHTAFDEASSRINQCLSYRKFSPEPICLAVIGESRTGKSRLLEETARARPTYRTKAGLVVPLLRAKVPSRPTIKGVASAMLKVLGDRYWEKGTEAGLTSRLQTLLQECQTEGILLDEFQHFYDKRSQRSFESTEWLKTLADEAKVSLITFGLQESMLVIRCNEQLSGRFLAPVRLPRFEWLLTEDREEFIGILGAFQDSISTHFKLLDLTQDEVAFRVWCATGGLIGYVALLMRQAVWNAVDEGHQAITLEHLDDAYQASIGYPDSHGAKFARSPFSRDFAVEALQENVSLALSVGVRQAEPDPVRRRSRRAKPASAQEALFSGTA